MEPQRKTYTPEAKLKVVLESLQRDETLEAVCQRFGVSKSMVHPWRQDFQAHAANALLDKRNSQQKAVAQAYPPGESLDELKRIIGDLTFQLEIVKKAASWLSSRAQTTVPRGGALPAGTSNFHRWRAGQVQPVLAPMRYPFQVVRGQFPQVGECQDEDKELPPSFSQTKRDLQDAVCFV